MLQEGNPAPLFSLPDADMETVDLASFIGRYNVILFFYPKDDTPGCTMEAIDFGDHEEEFLQHDCIIFGISRDDCISHAAFRDKHGLSVRLLSDTDGEACEKYGVWQEKEKDGVKKMSIVRSTFVIDKTGKIRHAFYNINPKGHAAEIFRLIKSLENKAPNPSHVR